MPKGRLYDREGIATIGGAEPRDMLSRKACLFLSVCVLTVSNRCSKDSSRVHKGLVTNWPHHNVLSSGPINRSTSSWGSKNSLHVAAFGD